MQTICRSSLDLKKRTASLPARHGVVGPCRHPLNPLDRLRQVPFRFAIPARMSLAQPNETGSLLGADGVYFRVMDRHAPVLTCPSPRGAQRWLGYPS